MSAALFNQRGRLIWVPDKEVKDHLKKGFVYPPRDHDVSVTYNHIYDKGHEEARTQEQSKKVVKQMPPSKAQKLGNILETESV